MARILVIDDEPGICRSLERWFQGRGDEVRTSSRAETGLTLAEAFEPDVVLLDVRLPGMSGLAALSHLLRRDPALPVVVITAYGTMETAVEAVRRGAWDYLLKPLDLPETAAVVDRAVEGRRQAAEVVIGSGGSRPAPGAVEPARALVPMVGRTRSMLEVFKRIGALSLSDEPVLLVGERGTGKETAARAIHASSARRDGPFVVAGPAALETAAEERLAEAAGGTLYIEDLADVPPPVQARLLALFDARDRGEAPPDPRLMAGSPTDLKGAVDAGRFRADLRYRWTGRAIELPPLRERTADVPALVAHFLGRAGGLAGGISREALRLLAAAKWPGNVEELKSVLEQAILAARGGPILPRHLPESLAPPPEEPVAETKDEIRAIVLKVLAEDLAEGSVYQRVMDRFEAPLIAEVLRRTDGNQVQAAKLLGIHRTTLRMKIRRHGL